MKNPMLFSRHLKKNKSFTIIELLIALTIFSIIIILFYSLWRMNFKTSERTKEIAQIYMGARAFLDRLSKELRSSFDLRWPDPDNPQAYLPNFKWDINSNDEKQLEFWETAPDEIPIKYPYMFYIHRTIYILKTDEEDKGKKILYKKVQPLNKIDLKGKVIPIVEGPILKGDFDIDIDVIQGKTPLPLPEKIIVNMTIKNKYHLRKVLPVYELKQPE